ncbi:MAG: FGGY-family carbohydrate kinase [Pseudomonadota bacterium]
MSSTAETTEQDILIGVDAGTSLVKCVAFSVRGEVLSTASTPNDYLSVGEDCVEQDMHVTRDTVIATLARLVEQLGNDASLVKAVALTGQGDGMWLVDSAGEPVHNAWLWLDSRAASIASELENHADYARLFELTGTAVNASQTRSQMIWLDQYDPKLLDRAAISFHCKDYLYHVLTGERATDPGEALFTFGDYVEGRYSDEVLRILGLSHRAALLPPIVDGLASAAPVLASISAQTGLPPHTCINLAPVDVICSALGGGLYDQGSASAMTLLGTTGVHMRYCNDTREVRLPKDRTGYTIVFPGGGCAQLQSNMSATMNIDWLLSLISDALGLVDQAPEDETILERLDALVGGAPAGSALYQPYISTAGERGPFFNADARAGFTGLDQHSGLAELARSVYEGICFAARDCYDDLGELPAEIRVTGGGAKSASLKQILASVMDRPVRSVERQESGAAGAAIIAAVQHNYYDSIDSCVKQWVAPHMGAQVLPDTGDSRVYQDLFPIYKVHRTALPPTWQQLANLRQSAHARRVPAAAGEQS